MDAEQLVDILHFLKQTPPFETLTEAELKQLSQFLVIRYLPQGVQSDWADDTQLNWLRTGAIQLLDQQGNVVDQLESGSCFGPQLYPQPHSFTLQVVEDTLLYSLSATALEQLQSLPALHDFIRAGRHRYLHYPETTLPTTLWHTPLTELLSPRVVSVSPKASVTQAAMLMNRERVSSLLVTRNQQLLGILTDRDLRSRVLAQGLTGSALVEDVMTEPVHTLSCTADVMDILLLMSQQQVHHVPLLDGGQLWGLCSLNDIMQTQRTTPIFLANELLHQTDVDAIAAIVRRLPPVVNQLLSAGVRTERLGPLLTNIADVVTRRLLVLAEAKLGPPPCPYCWVAFGSHARQELHLSSDQDNGLLLADTYTEADAPYFKALSEQVCQQLDRCGYELCPGQIMASNPTWRIPLQQWRQLFHDWIAAPTPSSLLKANTFFDMRAIAGELGLADALQQYMLQRAQSDRRFLAILTATVRHYRPAMGLFGQLRTAGKAKEETVNLKSGALSPLVDVARVYALAGGHAEVSTLQRLQIAGTGQELTQRDSSNLQQAFRWLSRQRYRWQGYDWQQGSPINHNLPLHQLNTLERHQLKDALRLIIEAQDALSLKFAGGNG